MLFWKRKPLAKGAPQPIIELFVRHCNYSAVSAHKKRPSRFSRKACHENLHATADARIHFTYFLDTFHEADHFIQNKAILIKEGTEAGSFLRLLDHVAALALHPDTIVYFVEDDYLHRLGWVDLLFEAFATDADYVTLYDHRDKYQIYPHLRSQIFITPSCHWRTTPSTTNTYAMRFSTLMRDLSIHRRFSLGRKITADHDKFTFLTKRGSMLISPMPGWSTHEELDLTSPCVDWDAIQKEHVCKQ